jgi:peptidylprolyl isomerase domain and WD repeat-containing protein 1
LGKACTPSLNEIGYESKLDTDLYELVKKKTYCVAAAATRDCYALYCHDGKVRIFRYVTGTIEAKLDERLKTYEKEQQHDPPEPDSTEGARAFPAGLSKLDALEFGRRAAVEREIQSSGVTAQHLLADPADGERAGSSSASQRMTLAFDPSGSYLLLPTLLGIKIVDWKRRKVRAILGEADASQLRFLSVCLCPGDAKVNRQMELARMSATAAAATGASADDNKGTVKPVDDSLVIALAYEKQRLYVFSHVDPVMAQPSGSKDGEEAPASVSNAAILSSRDVWNEAPSASDSLQMDALQSRHASQLGGGKRLPAKAILRTTMGDIHIQLFASQVPRTIENFAGHAASGYYDGVIFHRVIKGFMLQTGDPLGDGTGGESIWGGEFDDEFVPGLRHDRPFTVSMANAGPNTNGSQFFITTAQASWLDQKHTVFGRVVSGMDVCTAIENVRTDDLDKPLTEIRIVNVDVVDS